MSKQATWTTSGKYGNALSFNGSNARVNVPDAASLHLTTGMTLEAWVNPTAVSSAWRDVVYKGNDNYYLSATSSSGSKPAGGGQVGGSYAEAYGTAALAANTWTHLAGVYDADTNQLRVYVNGELSGVGTHATPWHAAAGLQIGRSRSGTSLVGFWPGEIDDVRVYQGVVDDATISEWAAA